MDHERSVASRSHKIGQMLKASGTTWKKKGQEFIVCGYIQCTSKRTKEQTARRFTRERRKVQAVPYHSITKFELLCFPAQTQAGSASFWIVHIYTEWGILSWKNTLYTLTEVYSLQSARRHGQISAPYSLTILTICWSIYSSFRNRKSKPTLNYYPTKVIRSTTLIHIIPH